MRVAADGQLKPAAHQVHIQRLDMSPEPIQDRLGPGGGGDDEDDLTPPTGLTLGPVLSSSEDELDHNGEPENFTFEYLPLSQDHDSEDDSENPQTLSDLMLALSVHGPNVIDGEGTEGGEGEGRQGVEIEVSSQTAELVQESAHAREAELRRDQAGVWNSCHVQPDSLELDRGKVEEIKSAMASVTLPPSAIPAWAHNISDEDWEHQVAKLLSRHSDK